MLFLFGKCHNASQNLHYYCQLKWTPLDLIIDEQNDEEIPFKFGQIFIYVTYIVTKYKFICFEPFQIKSDKGQFHLCLLKVCE